jgi:hypothetical protein
MAILTREADINEEIIKIDDVFDTFYTKEEVYTQTQINTELNKKVNKSGDTITGVLNVPTPALPSAQYIYRPQLVRSSIDVFCIEDTTSVNNTPCSR